MEEILGGAIGALLLSAGVRALPKPDPEGTGFQAKLYLWFYNFAHGILSNYDLIRRNGRK